MLRGIVTEPVRGWRPDTGCSNVRIDLERRVEHHGHASELCSLVPLPIVGADVHQVAKEFIIFNQRKGIEALQRD